MDDLTPCAHCGDDAQFVEHIIEGLWGVECTSCLAKMLYTALTKTEAAEHWNMRGPATRLAEVEAERDGMRAALESIDVYGSDTLSGRVKPDPTTYKAWLIEGIVEMRNRARAALGARP